MTDNKEMSNDSNGLPPLPGQLDIEKELQRSSSKFINLLLDDVLIKDSKCPADHTDYGGDVELTWTGLWCENCEEPLDKLVSLRELLSEDKLDWMIEQLANRKV